MSPESIKVIAVITTSKIILQALDTSPAFGFLAYPSCIFTVSIVFQNRGEEQQLGVGLALVQAAVCNWSFLLFP